MKRYLDTASRLVTSNDELIESLEGLECLVLEAVFHLNAGNLRRAWLFFKRAIGLAQLVGLDSGNIVNLMVLDPNSIVSPAIMWYRIVGQDRYLALVLVFLQVRLRTPLFPRPPRCRTIAQLDD